MLRVLIYFNSLLIFTSRLTIEYRIIHRCDLEEYLSSSFFDLNKQQLPLIIIQEIEQILCQVDKYEQKYNVPVKVILAKLINHLLYIEKTHELNNYITELVKNRQSNNDLITLVDMNKSLDDTKYYLDNVHPNELGYKKMAELWLEKI